MRKYAFSARFRRALVAACAASVLFGLSVAFAAEKPVTTPRPTAVPSLYDTLPAPCDVLVVLAHPGDETLFFPGLLGTLAGGRGLDVRVLYLSCASEELRAFAEETLAASGVTNPPEFWNLGGIYYETRQHAANNCGGVDKLIRNMTDLIRYYRPKYVVTHDPEGEYGHGLHVLASEIVTRACANSHSPKKLANSVKTYGIHAPEYIYYHTAEPEGAVVLDLNEHLTETTLRDANAARYDVLRPLLPIGIDITRDAYTQPLFRAEAAPGSSGTDAGLFSENDPSVPRTEYRAPEVVEGDYCGVFSETESAAARPEEGFWEYRSPNLAVTVEHREFKTDEGQDVAYNVAHIFTQNEDAFVPGIRETKAHEYPWFMARRYKAVLAITGDNMTVAEGKYKGIIIRDGEVFNDRAGADTLVMGADGSLRILPAGEQTAEQLLAEGVRNTFSFGPTLIANGRIQHEQLHTSKVQRKNPRVAIGMVEPGHLVVIQVDGRQRGYSLGVTLEMLAAMFWAEGCTEAYNLDGGRSAALVFMGEHINRHAGNSADIQRALPDALMWGRSDLVPGPYEPVYNIGNGPRKEPYLEKEPAVK
ncbi:MAG: phosphodiester glycosidase family protein [Clostridia bacterium]|nr:phosphodiester glycosidase family protein [Clostridia bacterium]